MIAQEKGRRLQEHRQSSPVEQRRDKVTKELARVEQQTDKLLDAYQEGLLDLDQLRLRTPELKKRQVALEKELESLQLQAMERERLAELNVSLGKFADQLKDSAQKLVVEKKQKIPRLLIRDVSSRPDNITIHHTIPLYLTSPAHQRLLY